METSYQVRKARAIVALLLTCQAQSTLTRFQLAKVVSLMSQEDWRLVCFTAGVPVADIPAKAVVLRTLRAKALHAV